MLTVNTNTTSLITQLNLSRANNCVKTSIERLSTGCKINRASDDAANMSISKNMSCQISGTDVALDNAQQAVNLLQTADGVLDSIQADLLRIRDLAVEASNGTYSAEEKKMLQQEVNQRIEEIYKQRNNAMFNQIRIFGEAETPPSIADSSGSGADTATTTATAVGGTVPVTPLTEAEAIAQGYTCIKSESDFMNIKSDTSGKYCLMCDIDFSKISGWGNVTLNSGGEVNGNGYSVNNLTINSTTNTDMHGLFRDNAGTIKNLSMNNVSIENTNNYIGGLVGGSSSTSGTVDNCSVSGSIKGGQYTGGLVGYSYSGSSITNSSSSGTVTGTGNYTGGLVGANAGGTITNSSSSGNVTGTGYCTGGLVGANTRGTITNSSSSGNVTGTSVTGGLVGMINSSSITNCLSSGSVTGTSVTGGLVGMINSSSITNCLSSGSVTGTEQTGGLGGNTINGTITNSSSSGSVTGTARTGGLVGKITGTIDKSYSTGDVSGTDYVGGLVGCKFNGNISNSYALGDVSGGEYVGGLVGQNIETISTSYSTGTVIGTGTNVGGFVGVNGSSSNEGNINNSYTTSELDFYGTNNKGTIENNHGTTTQEGVTAHDARWWFKDGSNLTFLGDAYDTRYNPPDLKENSRGEKLSVNTTFQIGANSGEENTLTIDTGFSLENYYADVTTLEGAQKAIDDTDVLSGKVSSFRSVIGATQNRLESVTESLMTRKNNMEASHSTIVDTDFALESSKLVQQQILQNVTASLLAQANSNPEIALTLLK